MAASAAPALIGYKDPSLRAAPLEGMFLRDLREKQNWVLPEYTRGPKDFLWILESRPEPSESVASVPTRVGTERLETEQGINCGGGESGIPPRRQAEIKRDNR